MKIIVLILSSCCIVFAHHTGLPNHNDRHKRDVAGQLEIVSNNAQTIHADVTSDAHGNSTGDVTPPKNAIYSIKSARKSWPLNNKLDLVRSLTRVITLAVLVFSAAIEFYPLIHHVYHLYYL